MTLAPLSQIQRLSPLFWRRLLVLKLIEHRYRPGVLAHGHVGHTLGIESTGQAPPSQGAEFSHGLGWAGGKPTDPLPRVSSVCEAAKAHCGPRGQYPRPRHMAQAI